MCSFRSLPLSLALFLSPGHVNMGGWHLWAFSTALSVFSCQSEIHSWPGWQSEHWQGCQSLQNLKNKQNKNKTSTAQKHEEENRSPTQSSQTIRKYIVSAPPTLLNCLLCFLKSLSPSLNPPKHLLWLVARSTKTLAEMTLPNGRNICSISESVNSCGRW